MWHVHGIKEMHTHFWRGNLKKRSYLDRFEDNIKTDLKDMGRLDWINLAQDRET
jgi:hypothetical protein